VGEGEVEVEVEVEDEVEDEVEGKNSVVTRWSRVRNSSSSMTSRTWSEWGVPTAIWS
jgi:hypothetical protein